MSYIGWFHVKEHVQSFQNMHGKGGLGVFKAELRPAEVDPRLKKKKKLGCGVKKNYWASEKKFMLNPPERSNCKSRCNLKTSLSWIWQKIFAGKSRLAALSRLLRLCHMAC